MSHAMIAMTAGWLAVTTTRSPDNMHKVSQPDIRNTPVHLGLRAKILNVFAYHDEASHVICRDWAPRARGRARMLANTSSADLIGTSAPDVVNGMEC